jgi:hypothetical protein
LAKPARKYKNRPAPRTNYKVTLYIPASYVCDYKAVDHVFLNVISPKIWEASKKYLKDKRLYKLFRSYIDRGDYLVWCVYGLPAIRPNLLVNPERPVPPAIKLAFVIGEGEDTVEQLPVEPWKPPEKELTETEKAQKRFEETGSYYEDVPDGPNQELNLEPDENDSPDEARWKAMWRELREHPELDYDPRHPWVPREPDPRVRAMFGKKGIPGKPGRKLNKAKATPKQLERAKKRAEAWKEKKINEAYLKEIIWFEMQLEARPNPKSAATNSRKWPSWRKEYLRRIKEAKAAGRKVTRKDLQDAMEDDPIYDNRRIRKPWLQEPWDDGVLDKE